MRRAGRGRGFPSAPLLLATLLCLAAAAGCGLETVPYLYPPTVRTDNDLAASGNYVSAFTNNTLNDTGAFLPLGFGYSLYYRIYLSADKAAADSAAIVQLDTDDPTGVEARLRNQFHYLPFDAQGSGDLTDEPTIALVAGEISDPALNFNIVAPGYTGAAVAIPDTEFGVFRSTSTGIDYPRLLRATGAGAADPSFFKLSINAADPDKDVDPAGFTSAGTYAVYIQIVVMSYGVDATSFAPTFSTAALLRSGTAPFRLDSVAVTQ